MSKLGDLELTGRSIDGPAADLVECVNAKGLKFTAIQLHEAHRDHPDLLDRVENAMDFLRKPGVDDVVPLTEFIADDGALLYPTGTGWSVAEVVRVLADLGEEGGVRAGLELAYRASQSLLDACEAGEKHEIYNHGNVNPWTLFVKPDGTVRVIGYGIPQVEIYTFLDDETELPEEDSFRYCPPERLEGEEEDITTDLFGLTLVAVELMIGRPVYDGLVSDLRQQASRAEGSYRLYKWRDKLPETVRDVLSRALKYDLDSRHADPLDFVYAVHDILNSIDADGPSLAEIANMVKRETMTGDTPITGGATTMLTKAELARLAGDMEDVEAAPLDAPRRPRPSDEPEEEEDDEPSRWGSVKRGGGRRGRKDEAAAEKPKEAASPGGDRKDRLRDRLRGGRGREESKAEPSKDRKADLRSRLRGSRDGPPSKSKGDDSDGKRDALKRRLRRSRDDDDDDKKDNKSDKRDALRSRLRRSADKPSKLPDRPRRSRDDDDDDDDSEEVDDAAALLARLRSSIGGASADEPDDADDDDDDDDSDESEPDDESDELDAPDDDEAADDDPVPEQAADEDEDEDDEDEDDEDEDEDEDEDTDDEDDLEHDVPDIEPTEDVGDELLDEIERDKAAAAAPAATAAPAGAAGGLTFEVQLNGTREVASLSPDSTIADAASRLIGQLGGVPTDLTGQLTGWYRLQQGDALISGGKRVRDLDPDKGITLSFVRNDVVRVTFEVQGLDTPMRFSAPVGTAVPARSLIQHLSHWLKLPDSEWSLAVGDKLLGPAQILEEFGLTEDIVVVVRK